MPFHPAPSFIQRTLQLLCISKLTLAITDQQSNKQQNKEGCKIPVVDENNVNRETSMELLMNE